MHNLDALLEKISDLVWSEYLLIPLLAVVGMYITMGTFGVAWRHLPEAFVLAWRGRHYDCANSGEISPFQALMTALAATIGTGNIAGVATAIYLGGPGAVFWMWVIAAVGMSTKYAETLLAIRFREIDVDGRVRGGPMYYIHKGMGPNWHWLATSFALFGMLAAFGIGNMVQANSVADVLHATYKVPTILTGTVIAVLVAFVILGGVRRIAEVAAHIVPFMAILYLTGALGIVLVNYEHVPDVFLLILTSAFKGTAATGGFAGATVAAAIQMGFARGIFSNEAGLGSAAIAHAAVKIRKHPRGTLEQGLVAMLGTFLDTIVACSLTAFAILVTDVWRSGETGAALASMAFGSALGDYGGHIVSIGLALFAFSTILGWSYYGERCAEFVTGSRIIPIYRVAWIAAVWFGANFELHRVWTIADVLNGLMALPNLAALITLSPLVFAMTREQLKKT